MIYDNMIEFRNVMIGEINHLQRTSAAGFHLHELSKMHP